jgi:hypothetical protein
VKPVGLICALAAVLCTGAASSAAPGGSIGGTVRVAPVHVAIDLPARAPQAGTTFNLRARVTNDGSTPLNGVTVQLVAPAALVLYDPVVQSLPRIAVGGTRNASWQACVVTGGHYVVLARAALAPFLIESTSAVVSVQAARRPTC